MRASGLWLLGCVALGCGGEPGEVVGSSAAELRSFNGMLPGRLEEAALRSGDLLGAMSATSKQALADVATTKSGRQLLRYLTGCAWPAGARLEINDASGQALAYRGAFGFAAGWLSRPLTNAEVAAVSACLEAHTNAFGVVVPLSVRGPYPSLKVTQNEARLYRIEEAAFHGFVVDPARSLVACTGKGAFDPTDKSNPYLATRVCGRSAACGFSLAGPCGPYDGTQTRSCERTGSHGQQLSCHDEASATAAWLSPASSALTTYVKAVDIEYLWGLVRHTWSLPTGCDDGCHTLVLQDAVPTCLPCPEFLLQLDDFGVFSCRAADPVDADVTPVCAVDAPPVADPPPAEGRPGRGRKGDELAGAGDGAAAGGCGTGGRAGGAGSLALVLILALGRRRRS